MSRRVPPDFVEPAFLSVPDGFDPNRTLGSEVAAVATLAGFPPDPEQRFCLDVSFALDKRGRFLVFETVLIAPRQNLKTGFEKQRALGKLFVCDRPLGVWSAHEFETSRRALLDVEAMIDGSDLLRKQVRLTARGNVASHGAVPEIVLNSGATLAFRTRTAGGGAGLTGDDLTIDEAWAAQARQMGVILPIMLARPNSQMDVLSSACHPESAYLWDLVQRGRAGGGPRMFYAEWCAPPPAVACDLGEKCDHRRVTAGCGCDKPEVIVLAHSAVTRGRIELGTVADLRRTMPEDEYPREIMGWHDKPIVMDRPIDPAVWDARGGADGRPDGPFAFALSASWPEAEWGSIVVAGQHGGEVYVQLVEYKRGTSWMPARMKELRDEWKPVAVILNDKDPAAVEKAAVEKAGVALTSLTLTQSGQAYGMFIAAAAGDAPYLRHYDQPAMKVALEAAQKRPRGDAHTWDIKGSTDIGPIVAATDALYGLATHKPMTPFALLG